MKGKRGEGGGVGWRKAKDSREVGKFNSVNASMGNRGLRIDDLFVKIIAKYYSCKILIRNKKCDPGGWGLPKSSHKPNCWNRLPKFVRI